MEVRQRKGQASNGGTKDGDMASSKGPQPQSPPPPPKSKLQTLMIRSVVGIIMILSFLLILWSGHAVVCLFVFALQVVAFREFINLRYRQEKEKKLATFRTLHWYFLFVTVFWVYGKGVFMWAKGWEPLRAVFLSQPTLEALILHRHNWHSFVLYTIGFVWAVISFRNQTLKYQIGQLTWTVMIILLVVVQPHFIATNIFQGLVWLVLPHTMIVCNDIMAYFVGITIGHKFVERPLTKLSPNKTWEGFVGAAVLTLGYALLAAAVMSEIPWMRCSQIDLELHGGCERGYMFSLTTLDNILPRAVIEYLPQALAQISLRPIQAHAIVFSLFASLIAPFGGFYASAIKRAYKIKDYDTLFPGHGGVVDRFDCQILMGIFVYVYYTTFVRPVNMVPDVDSVLAIVTTLSRADQQVLLEKLSNLIK